MRSLKNRLWRDWLDRRHRCVVLATAFFEPDKITPKGAVVWRWFERMTTEPNGIVEPIHEKAMPVMLMTPDDVDQWSVACP